MSRSLNSRPRFTAMLNTSKYPGEIAAHPAGPGGSAWPAMSKGRSLAPCSGTCAPALAAATPGIARIRLQPEANRVRHARRGRVFRPAQQRLHGHHVLGLESPIDAIERHKTANQQSRAHQQDHRQAHFAHHQRRASPALPQSRTFAAVLQERIQIHSRAAQRRKQAEQHRRQQRDRQAQTPPHASPEALLRLCRPPAGNRPCLSRVAHECRHSRAAAPAPRRPTPAARSRSEAAARSFPAPLRSPRGCRFPVSSPRPAPAARFATFAQAISNTSPTAPSSTSSMGRSSPVRNSRSGVTLKLWFGLQRARKLGPIIVGGGSQVRIWSAPASRRVSDAPPT